MSAAAAGIEKYPSFTKALFMGQLHSPALYPYREYLPRPALLTARVEVRYGSFTSGNQSLCAAAPDVLNDDQKDTIRQLLDPVWDFFANTNNAAANDETVCIADLWPVSRHVSPSPHGWLL